MRGLLSGAAQMELAILAFFLLLLLSWRWSAAIAVRKSSRPHWCSHTR